MLLVRWTIWRLEIKSSNKRAGAGAGFALEDVFVLTQSVKWAYERDLPVGQGLQLFDNVRSPHYERLVS